MKRKYLAALVLGASFFVLTGFDSTLTPKELFEACREATKVDSSLSADIDFSMNMKISVGSAEEEVPPTSMSALMRYNIDWDMLRDSSMSADMTSKILVPGQQLESSMMFYRVPGTIDAFENYAYTEDTDQWQKFIFPSEVDVLFEKYIDWAFSLISTSNPTEIPEIPNFLSPQTPGDADSTDTALQDKWTSYVDFYNELADQLKLDPDSFTVSAQPVDVNGTPCYELKTTISFEDLDMDFFAQNMMDTFYSLEKYSSGQNSRKPSSSDETFYLTEEAEKMLKQLSSLYAKAFENVSVNEICYIDASTFKFVKETSEFQNLNFDALMDFAIFAAQEQYGTYGAENPLPSIGFSVPNLTCSVTYDYDKVDEIKLPAEALHAVEVPSKLQ